MQSNDSIIYMWGETTNYHNWNDSTFTSHTVKSNNDSSFFHGDVVNHTIIGLILYNAIMLLLLYHFNDNVINKIKK